mgnify:CR=1 FL=1
MDKNELFALLDVDDGTDFQYFENFADLAECDEDIESDVLYDMLEDVDTLRAKKKVNPNRIWMRYASVAACLCVIIGAVYLLDRTGMIDTSEVADEMAQDNMSGEEKVHNYVRADIITSDSTALAVTDPQKITAIYDILRTELKSEAAADDKLYSENDNKAAGEMADGNGKTEDIGGSIR